jgi:hypothetical protein
MVLTIVQLCTCVRALRLARDTRSGAHYNFYNYTTSILVLMLWVLPINMPVLIVWIHNVAVHWLTPFSTHHNLLAVLPLVLVVEIMSTGNMTPRVTGRARFITNVLTFLSALYAAIYGVTYAYRLHHLLNILAAWLRHPPLLRLRRHLLGPSGNQRGLPFLKSPVRRRDRPRREEKTLMTASMRVEMMRHDAFSFTFFLKSNTIEARWRSFRPRPVAGGVGFGACIYERGREDGLKRTF